MRFLIILAALQMSTSGVFAQQQMRIKVGVHQDLRSVINNGIIQNVIKDANFLIENKNTSRPDVACPVGLTMTGSVTYDPRIPADFNDFAKHKDARALGYQLLILPRISNCAGSGNALGCTWIGGGVATVRGSSAGSALVTAHEIGHSLSLRDVVEVTRIMEFQAVPGNDTLTDDECDKYNGPAAVLDPDGPEPPLPTPPTVSNLTIDDLLNGKGFYHGVLNALPSIKAHCNDNLQPVRDVTSSVDFLRRARALWILGRCGDATDLEAWRSTLRAEVGTNLAVLDAKEAALISLGVLIARTDSPQAVVLLESYVVPEPLLAPALPAGVEPPPGVPPQLIQGTLVDAALRGKAVSGRLLATSPNQPSPIVSPNLFNLQANAIAGLSDVNRTALSGDVDAALAESLRMRLR